MVIQGEHECLLGYRTAVDLGIVRIHTNEIIAIVNTNEQQMATVEELSKEKLKHVYPKLFSGKLGCKLKQV